MAIIAHPDNFHDDTNGTMPEMETDEHYETAIEQVQFLMEKVGDQPDLHVKMADIYSKAGRTADAIVHYETAICAQPNYLEATIKLGTHYLRAQNASLAAMQFNRAIEINDDIVDAYVGLSVAQNYSGAERDALKTLSLASAIQQNSSLLFSETAILNLQAALIAEHADLPAECVPPVEMKEVIEAHRQQLENLPRSADAHYKFGILMMSAGNLKGAVDSFQNSITINPTHCRAQSKLAICLHEANNSQAAIDVLTGQDDLDHDTVALHYQTAMLYADRTKFAAAVQEMENTMKNNFTESDATENIQVVLENIGLVDRATATWERLTETARSAIGARYE
jgi:tetratricopeptide (TPR) repeat protein